MTAKCERFAVEIVDEQGQVLKQYAKDGSRFICGKQGQAYKLRLKNNHPGRILVVATVDGVSVMDGKPGKLTGENGYVLYPYQTCDIPGWRLSNEEVAAFRFGGPGESYAAKMQLDTNNLGIIGVAFFEEKVTQTTVYQGPPRQHTNSGPRYRGGAMGQSLKSSDQGSLSADVCDRSLGFGSNEARQGLGTQFGEKVAHHVRTVTFEARDQPAEVLSLRYNDAENLFKMGIRVDGHYVPGEPDPFPATPKPEPVGCQPPGDWKG